MKKYELTDEFIINPYMKTLYRIRALIDFADVKKGDLGGFIEKEKNLSHEGNAWVYDDAQVFNNASVYDNAVIKHRASVCGHAKVYGNARVCEDSSVSDSVRIFDNSSVGGNACVTGRVYVFDNAYVSGNAYIHDEVRICGYAMVYGETYVCGKAMIGGVAKICDNVRICNNAKILNDHDYTIVKGFGRRNGWTVFFRCQDEKLRVVCGCFFGDMEEFRSAIKRTHGDSKMAKEYLAIADLMEMHFGS